MLDEIVDRGARRALRDPSAETDERLADRVCAGDGPAFAELVRRHRPALIGYARRLARTDAGAEDAVQHAFLQAWIALRRDGAEIRDVRAWLFRTVHNATISGLRRPRPEPLDAAAMAESRSAAVEFEAQLVVREALAGLAALPELQRNVMLSTAVGGENHEQVAAAYGLTKDSVRGLIYRARANLRAAVAAVAPAPLLTWLTRDRSIRGPGGDALVGAGSAGVVGGALKSGVIVVGLVASTGGLGVAVLTVTHDRDPARRAVTVHHARDIDLSRTLTRTANAQPQGTSATSARPGRTSGRPGLSGGDRARESAAQPLPVTHARGSAVRAVSFALGHSRSWTRGLEGRSGTAPGQLGHDGVRPSTPGSRPGDGASTRSSQPVSATTGSSAGSSSGSGDGQTSGSGAGSGDGGTRYGDGGTSGGSASGTGSGTYGGGGSGGYDSGGSDTGSGSYSGSGTGSTSYGAGSDGANATVSTGSGDGSTAGGSDQSGLGGGGAGSVTGGSEIAGSSTTSGGTASASTSPIVSSSTGVTSGGSDATQNWGSSGG
jgi:RNA polymerase sigma factor (sigma-70 family)